MRRTPMIGASHPPVVPCADQSGPVRSTPTGRAFSPLDAREIVLGKLTPHERMAFRCRTEHIHPWTRNMRKITGAVFTLAFLWTPSATAVELPAARLYRALTDLCIDHYLRDKDLNDAQLNTGRPLTGHCDCLARFLFPYMDAEAIRQLETRIPDKFTTNWDDATLRCSTLMLR